MMGCLLVPALVLYCLELASGEGKQGRVEAFPSERVRLDGARG